MVSSAPRPVIYTDAAYNPGNPIPHGWMVLPQNGRARSGCGVVPEALVASLRKRNRKYWQASSWPYCPPWQRAGKIRGHRLLTLVGSQPALSSLVGGGAAAQNLASIVCVTHVRALEPGCTIGVEFVGSDSDYAGGPSRAPYRPWASSELARWLACTIETAALPETIDCTVAQIEALASMAPVRTVGPAAE